MKEDEIGKRNFSIFAKAIDDMIATNATSYKDYETGYSSNRSGGFLSSTRSIDSYTNEEIDAIIAEGYPMSMSDLSRSYFFSSGFYRRILFYYSHLLSYSYLVIPHFKDKPNAKSQKSYLNALDYCDNIKIKSFCAHAATRVLVDGAYFGAIVERNGETATMDLPFRYCRTRFKSFAGLDIVEFDVSYFNTITEGKARQAALDIYPKNVKKAFNQYLKSGLNWCMLDEGVGIYLKLYENRPFFLNTLKAVNNFEAYRDLEIKKEELETKKILIQEIPVDKDGQLIFEPEEAKELHRGAVKMLSKNTSMDVLTTYAKVKLESLADSRQTVNSNLETFQSMIYSESGASSNIFAATGNLSLDQSLKNDLSLMMNLADQFSSLFSYLLNKQNGRGNVSYSLVILPISYYNNKEYIEQTFKLATSGYSYLLPAVASGLTQKEFLNLKILENDILKLGDQLIPLGSAFTQSSAAPAPAGRPKLPDEEKTDKTITNEGG